MSAYVVVQLAASCTEKRARHEHDVLTHHAVKRLLIEHGAQLIASPRSKAASDEPSPSATIAVPDMARADKLAAALRGMDGIEAAYAKPGEELP